MLGLILRYKTVADIYIYIDENNTPLGTVRADWDEQIKAYVLSWTVDPGLRRQGIGKKMVYELAQSLRGEVRAEVKKNNTASSCIAMFAGMSLDYEENDVLYYSSS